MAVRAGEAWAALAADAGEELLVRTGGLDAGPGAEDCAKALAECNVEHAWLTGAQVRDRFPGIGARPGERMLFQPDSAFPWPGARSRRCSGSPAATAPRSAPGPRCSASRPASDQVLLRTAAGEVTARTAVITAGPWAQGVLAGALPQVPRLTATVQQVRYFAPRDPAAPWPTLIEWPPDRAVLVRGARGRWRPRGEGGRAHPRPARWTRRTARSPVDPALEARGGGVCPRPPAWPGPGRAGRGDLPVHDDLGRGFRARPGRAAGGRRRLQRARVQVRAAARRVPGGPGARARTSRSRGSGSRCAGRPWPRPDPGRSRSGGSTGPPGS